MRRAVMAALVWGLLLVAPGTAAGQDVPAGQDGAGREATEPLRPGDLVRLRIWGDTLMQAELPVDERGDVVFPRLGSRHVLDLTPQDLRDQVVGEYRRMLREAPVEVITLRRVLVLGAVRVPGTHFMPTGHTRLSDALGEAGGVMPEGRQDRVLIIRDGATVEHRFGGALRASDVALRSGDEVHVPERPWLARNQGVLASLISGGMSVLVALLWMANS